MSESYDFLVGAPINQVWVWGPVRLVIDVGSVYMDLLRFRFRDSNGGSTEIDATVRPTDAGPALGLISKRILSAGVEDATLVLTFDDGSEVRAHPDDRYESWSVVGNGKTVQCLPGGELGSW